MSISMKEEPADCMMHSMPNEAVNRSMECTTDCLLGSNVSRSQSICASPGDGSLTISSFERRHLFKGGSTRNKIDGLLPCMGI